MTHNDLVDVQLREPLHVDIFLNRHVTQLVLKCLKCFLLLLSPNKFLVFLRYGRQWLHDLGEVCDESSIITCQSKKLSDLHWCLRGFLLFDGLKLSRINMDSFFIYHMTEKVYFTNPKITF